MSTTVSQYFGILENVEAEVNEIAQIRDSAGIYYSRALAFSDTLRQTVLLQTGQEICDVVCGKSIDRLDELRELLIEDKRWVEFPEFQIPRVSIQNAVYRAIEMEHLDDVWRKTDQMLGLANAPATYDLSSFELDVQGRVERLRELCHSWWIFVQLNEFQVAVDGMLSDLEIPLGMSAVESFCAQYAKLIEQLETSNNSELPQILENVRKAFRGLVIGLQSQQIAAKTEVEGYRWEIRSAGVLAAFLGAAYFAYQQHYGLVPVVVGVVIGVVTSGLGVKYGMKTRGLASLQLGYVEAVLPHLTQVSSLALGQEKRSGRK